MPDAPCVLDVTSYGLALVETAIGATSEEIIARTAAPVPVDDLSAAPWAESSWEAAPHSFATHGFNGVSVRTLNRELGVSHNLLHQRYSSKEGICYAAVDWGFGHLVTKLLAADDASAPPLDRLRAFIPTFIHVAGEHPELLRLMNIEGGESSERLDYTVEHFIEPQLTRFRHIWQQLAERGEGTDVPPEVMYFLVTSGDGAMFASSALTEKLCTGRPLEPQHYAAHAEQFTDLLMGALKH